MEVSRGNPKVLAGRRLEKTSLAQRRIRMSKHTLAAGVMAATLLTCASVQAAPTEITFWHAMANTLGDWVSDLTAQYTNT